MSHFISFTPAQRVPHPLHSTSHSVMCLAVSSSIQQSRYRQVSRSAPNTFWVHEGHSIPSSRRIFFGLSIVSISALAQLSFSVNHVSQSVGCSDFPIASMQVSSVGALCLYLRVYPKRIFSVISLSRSSAPAFTSTRCLLALPDPPVSLDPLTASRSSVNRPGTRPILPPIIFMCGSVNSCASEAKLTAPPW